MKLLFWETGIPKDKIVICVMLFIPLYYVDRAILASASRSFSEIKGSVNVIRFRGDICYLTDLSFYCMLAISFVILGLFMIVVVSGLTIAYNWLKTYNAH